MVADCHLPPVFTSVLTPLDLMGGGIVPPGIGKLCDKVPHVAKYIQVGIETK